MKKALLLVSVLFISVVSTACINKFAVQELNNKAKSYIEQGDYQNAIERLKSSVDLDETVFETHYNLAVAYTQAEDYEKAITSYKKAIELKPDFADAYYSLAVAQENCAADLAKGRLKVNGDLTIVKVSDEELSKMDKLSYNEQTESTIVALMADSVKNYNLYLEKGQNVSDKDEVSEKIKSLIEETESGKYLQTDKVVR
ncbi:tetratricopeptide repeat protein [bacterium]|nr:tetratricopeptide repeat protein [bacterium]